MRPALAALALLLAAGCGSTPPRVYEAASGSAATRVDGDARDWRGALYPVPEEAGLTFGVREAGGDLLVCREAERVVDEGPFLQGPAATVQVAYRERGQGTPHARCAIGVPRGR